ncbi:hypothetical protein AVEN_127671-1 [Araneus ventricosus]|uniref:Uncharacterized protein n=1 Tax=Araneus ventricosus TaxID=182803 RepID=A0A4Y2PA14_ARAVE|nr:hypothetical protein AVEN_127671-1 [Araneus ventricosus]
MILYVDLRPHTVKNASELHLEPTIGTASPSMTPRARRISLACQNRLLVEEDAVMLLCATALSSSGSNVSTNQPVFSSSTKLQNPQAWSTPHKLIAGSAVNSRLNFKRC